MIVQQKCSVEGCEKGGRYKKGLCPMHYSRQRTYGTVYYETAYDKRPAIISGYIAKIPLGFEAKEFALVDIEDAWVAKYNWHNHYGYAQARVNKKMVRLHRLLLQPPDHMSVDHKDGDSLNNRRSNLRVCTPSENTYNAKLSVSNTSGYKGVYFQKSLGKYVARIGREGTYLGVFTSVVEAAKVYNEHAKKRYGEFARLNPL